MATSEQQQQAEHKEGASRKAPSRTYQSADMLFSYKISRFVSRCPITGKRFNTTPPSSMSVTREVGVPECKRPRAIVLVLGFGGAKPRHVAKYAHQYNNKGCTAISGTASNHDIFINPYGVDRFAKNAVQQVVHLLRENDAKNPISSSEKETPIVMHIISNGGAFVARSIGHMLDSRDYQKGCIRDDLDLFSRRLKLGCQVFDSAPCYIDKKSSFNVIKHLIPNPFIGIPAAVLFALNASIISYAISLVTRQPTFGEIFWNDLLKDTNCNRQAFLYSHDDDIADGKKIEAFIRERENRGVHIMAKHFEDSKHVQHLRLHEKGYSAFIDTILTDMEESNK